MKKRAGSDKWVEPGDAPEPTAAMRGRAEIFDGDRLVARGRGRPKSGVAKEQISIRLDPDIVARLRESGPGWQSRINTILRESLDLADERRHAA
jgi:uncharacterized protein (DUF4415 family)